MKKAILLTLTLASAQFASAQLQIGSMDLLDGAPMFARGTDTIFTLGVENAFNDQQIAIYTTPAGGMLMGTSEYPTTDFAQQFELFGAGATVDGMVLWVADAVYGSGNAASHIKARLYSMNGTNGTTSAGTGQQCPNTVLAFQDIAISGIDPVDFTYADLTPTWVPSTFAVGYNISGVAAGDSVNLAATSSGYVELEDYSWIRLGPSWVTLKAAIDGDGNIDLVAGPIFTPSSVNVGENTWLNGLQMTLLNGNPVSDLLTVQYAIQESANMALKVVDTKGRVLVDQALGTQAGQHQLELQTNDWAAGQYFVSLFANGQPLTKRVVKE